MESDELDEQELKPRGLVGLTNIGNTCYMNSALQALSNCPQVTRFFLQSNDFLILPSEDTKSRSVSNCFKDVITHMWDRKRPKYLNPSELMRAIRFHNPMFRGYSQQDTQEFLRCIMDRLHEELKQEVTCFDDLDDSTEHDDENDDNENDVRPNDKKLLGGNGSSDEMEIDEEHPDQLLHRRHRKRMISYSTRKELRRSRSKSQNHHPRKEIKYRSIITCLFDGRLLSSVQCLTCNRISDTVETFQDLSLPIPSPSDLNQMHSKAVLSCSPDMYNDTGWFSYLWYWMKSWVAGPEIKLQDCLAAFFTHDELKGDNMYSCEKCKKLRNGIKYSRVNFLPEILCVHLKRFRHELYHSSKINTSVSFPLYGLDMQPFVSKECVKLGRSFKYNLTAIICHFGSVGGGHYIAYAKNCINNRWYEFNDSRVNEVSESTVANAEAYVLFYSLTDEKADYFRTDIKHKLKTKDNSEETYYISKEWLNRFDSCVQPGPVCNYDFTCKHGGINLQSYPHIKKLLTPVPKSISNAFMKRFGGGPDICSLECCIACEEIYKKKQFELETFTKLNDEYRADKTQVSCHISVKWYEAWYDYVTEKKQEHPGRIDNSEIADVENVQDDLYGMISEATWKFLQSQYGGGPCVYVKNFTPEQCSQSEDDENEMTSAHL